MDMSTTAWIRYLSQGPDSWTQQTAISAVQHIEADSITVHGLVPPGRPRFMSQNPISHLKTLSSFIPEVVSLRAQGTT